MKSIYGLLIATLITISSVAQDSERKYVHEMGLSAASFDNFGFVYRLGKSNSSMWRASLLSLSYDNSSTKLINSTRDNLAYSYRIAIGKEFRKELHSKFEFRYGADVFFGGGLFKTENVSDDTSGPQYFIEKNKVESSEFGLNLVIGANYMIKPNIILGAEFNPFLEVTSSERSGSVENISIYNETKDSTDGLNLGIESNLVLITLAFRY